VTPDPEMQPKLLDCAVVGGGPAGLTAAIYLARFRLKVRVFDAGASRAALIPCTRNHAGFPDGISGEALLERMRAQAQRYAADLVPARVEGLRRTGDGFELTVDGAPVLARAVLLATGVTNRRPAMPEALHREALAAGCLRYCPVCDGYEVIDKTIAVIGTGAHGLRETEFLHTYTGDLTLIAPDGPHALSDEERERLRALGVRVVDGPVRDFRLEGGRIHFVAGDAAVAFDSVYPAMGSEVHSTLAGAVGAELSDLGCIKVDAHQRTGVPGLYAAGDVVIGLDQISHAMGEAGVAATTMRNDLADAARAGRA
jgi:thioredoxin reductase (NADPH)